MKTIWKFILGLFKAPDPPGTLRTTLKRSKHR